MKLDQINISPAPGQDHLTLTLLEGQAPVKLDEKEPIKCNIKGTLGAVQEYLSKRVAKDQFEQKDCHILVNRDEGTILFVFNEADAYTRGEVLGSLVINPKFQEFGINDSAVVWTPQELGMFFKMNRTYFPDRQENMKLVSELMNFTATVNNQIQRSMKENGDRTDNFSQVVNSNLPGSFKLRIPVLKGGPLEQIEVETFARISGREVAFILISPDAAALMEQIKFKEIEDQLSSIRDLAPDIAIIEV